MEAKVKWIGVRPERKGPVIPKEEVHAEVGSGLMGDHTTMPHRQVTIIPEEGLRNVAADLQISKVDPKDARRNIVISGLDFTTLLDATVRIGEAQIEITGICHPCQQMNQNIGDGARQAMRENVNCGLTARVIRDGRIAIGDEVVVLED